VKSGRYDTRDDFTVVIQPFLRNTVLPYTEVGSFVNFVYLQRNTCNIQPKSTIKLINRRYFIHNLNRIFRHKGSSGGIFRLESQTIKACASCTGGREFEF